MGVTPSLYGMRVRTNAPGGTCDVLAEFARARFGASLVSGVGPGRGKDVLPLPVSGIEAGIDAVAVRKSSTARQMKTMTPSATGIVETAFTAP
ncbi:hypothetical protein [Streptomyces hokutonensis]|uniref:hypothetical protein n=1 Tax=Streptomyces hokutonensis TaxID=1306990 RepID=UPI0036B32682